MVWATLTAVIAGLLLGLRFQMFALIAASGALTIVSCVAAVFMQLSFLTTLISAIVLLAALQIGYLIGVAATCAWSRIKKGSALPLPDRN